MEEQQHPQEQQKQRCSMCSRELLLSFFLSDFEGVGFLKTCLPCRRRKKAYTKPSSSNSSYDFGPTSLAPLPLFTDSRVLRWTAEEKATVPNILCSELDIQKLRRCSSCKTTYDEESFRKEVEAKEERQGKVGKLLSTCYRCRYYKQESRQKAKEATRQQERQKREQEKEREEKDREPYTYRVSKHGRILDPPTDFPYKKNSANNPTFTYNVETIPITSVIKQPLNRPSFGLLDTAGASSHAVAQAVGFQEKRAHISALYEGPYSTRVKVPPNTAAQEQERRREELKKRQLEEEKRRRRRRKEEKDRRREEKRIERLVKKYGYSGEESRL